MGVENAEVVLFFFTLNFNTNQVKYSGLCHPLPYQFSSDL